MSAPLTLGTAGHIDHGKTALIRALTGVDTDRLPEERDRGISIELGYASLTLPSGRAPVGRRCPGPRAVRPHDGRGRHRHRPVPDDGRGRRRRDAADPRARRRPPGARGRYRGGRGDEVRPRRPELAMLEAAELLPGADASPSPPAPGAGRRGAARRARPSRGDVPSRAADAAMGRGSTSTGCSRSGAPGPSSPGRCGRGDRARRRARVLPGTGRPRARGPGPRRGRRLPPPASALPST